MIFNPLAVSAELMHTYCHAGLYDSIPLTPLEEHSLETAAEGLFWDSDFRTQLLTTIAATGIEVEKAFGGVPQDIEGVWQDGKVTVVQARPQVL